MNGNMNVPNATELYTFKDGLDGKFCLCILPQLKIIKIF